MANPRGTMTRKKAYWPKAIKVAEKSGEFTLRDYKRASSWVTCACGEQERVLMLVGRDMGPWDKTLDGLGMAFFDAVNKNDPKRARYILKNIQQRSRVLLAQVAKMTPEHIRQRRYGHQWL
jgi:hypothetical protein